MDMILHEIKNPLTILSGDIEMLNSFYKTEDIKVNKILDRMSRSEKRIRNYMDNLKLSENIKDIEIDIKDITYENFIRTIKGELNHWNKEIIFSYKLSDLSKTIKIDLDAFLEGFTNIIKNSETHANSKISINIYEDDSSLIVEVEDDGPGFSKEALSNYNKAYFSENPLVGNMGLGLYITDVIMKKLGIEMILTNKSGANTKLSIKLFNLGK